MADHTDSDDDDDDDEPVAVDDEVCGRLDE
jgi:hypothetical protein